MAVALCYKSNRIVCACIQKKHIIFGIWKRLLHTMAFEYVSFNLIENCRVKPRTRIKEINLWVKVKSLLSCKQNNATNSIIIILIFTRVHQDWINSTPDGLELETIKLI